KIEASPVAVTSSYVSSITGTNTNLLGQSRIGLVTDDNGGVAGYGDRLYFSGGDDWVAWNSDNSDPLWIARYNNASDQSELRVNIGDVATTTDKFSVGTTSAGSWNSHMVVQANGNVGIGTASPIEQLDVIGDGQFTGNIWINSTGLSEIAGITNTGMVIDQADFKVHLEADNNIILTAMESGNVGIGNTNPSVKLEVNGSVRGNRSGALRIDTGNGYVDIGPKNSAWSHFSTDRARYYFNKEIRVDTGYIGSYDEDLVLRTSGTDRITINNSTGSVYIEGPSLSLISPGISYPPRLVMQSNGIIAAYSSGSIIDSPGKLTLQGANDGEVIIAPNDGNVGIG
ncbi:MAG: hypothetical protein ACC656_15305, partial [Candidatus Heimdallarchaeota archaeon]